MSDTVLSLDPGPDDCLYRILRETKSHKKVVYVCLKHPDLIPKDSRTYGPDVINELSRLEEWSAEWQTLTISKDETGIRTQPNAFRPHALPKEQRLGSYDLFDITKFRILESTSIRVFRIRHENKQYFLKIARFEFEIASLAREVKAYYTLARHNLGLTPRIYGYAYEETRDRVVGLVFEEISGYHPDTRHLEACQAALQKLHKSGIIHGDVNRYNILITEDGVKFIDFEEASYRLDGQDDDDWDQKTDKEMQSLRYRLSDESGEGRPWAIKKET